ANSPVLRDFGLIACLALVAAGVFTIFILPAILEILRFDFEKGLQEERSLEFFGALDRTVGKWKLPLTVLLIVCSSFFLYHSDQVIFEDNLNNLSLYTDDLAEKEQFLSNIDPLNEKKIYLFASGKNMEDAIANNFKAYEQLKAEFRDKKVSHFVSTAP